MSWYTILTNLVAFEIDMRTYRQALTYLDQYANYELNRTVQYSPETFNLSRIEQLLDRLGNPHREFKSVHVAGTKGKGSTCRMIESVLSAAGYRTGLFTSPHLHTFRERIRINGRYITGEALGAMAEVVRPLVEREHAEHPELGRLTTFEVATALALTYFAREGVDYAVLEAGLGGRLDATNVVRPLVTVLTPIGLDHTSYLGDSVAAIAREKAAVIKPGGVVVSAAQQPAAQAVIEELAAAAGAWLSVVDRDWHWARAGDGQSIAVRGPEREHRGISVPLLGQHQLENAALAVAALDALHRRDIVVPEAAIRRGIATVRWPGRLEVLAERPLLVVDGAHNPDSMRRLREALGAIFGRRRLILVLGSSADKDLAGIAAEIVPGAAFVVVTRSGHPRAAPTERLAAIVPGHGVPVVAVDGVAAAVDRARQLAGPDDLICVTGSLFVVAEAREAVLGPAAIDAEDEP